MQVRGEALMQVDKTRERCQVAEDGVEMVRGVGEEQLGS